MWIILFESTKRDKFLKVELDLIFKEFKDSTIEILKFILPNIIAPHEHNDKTI